MVVGGDGAGVAGRAGEQRSGVRVFAHAEHGHVQRPGQGSDAFFGVAHQRVQHFGVERRREFAEEQQEAGSRGAALQQVAGHQGGVAVGVVARNDALVHQHDGHCRPVQVLFAQHLEQGDGRLAARDGEAGLAARRDGGAQGVGDVLREGRGGGVGVFGHRHQDSSTQELPSRAMSAEDAAGPQLPAV